MLAIAANVPGLQRLCLAHCAHVTDAAVCRLAAAATALQELDISGCKQVLRETNKLNYLVIFVCISLAVESLIFL